MRIRWSPEAADDLEQIVKFIRRDNPGAARRVARTIYEGVSILRTSPEIGRAGPREGSRELLFVPLPYVAVYRIKREVVEISRIYHTAQSRS